MAKRQTQNGEAARSRRQSPGIYKLRTAGNGGAFSIAVPAELGERLAGRIFRVSVTNQGILYTPVSDTEAVNFETDLNQAAWA